jgi:hypothetical protein
MNWLIFGRKIGEAALAGGFAAVVALKVTPGDDNYWVAVKAAFVAGALRGGLNAWKHL